MVQGDSSRRFVTARFKVVCLVRVRMIGFYVNHSVVFDKFKAGVDTGCLDT